MKKSCISISFILLILALAIFLAGPIVYKHAMKIYYPKKYSEIVAETAEKFNLDEDLIYSVIHAESKFDSDAVSHAGATGLMQITDETFEWINSKYPPDSSQPSAFNPSDNIHAGAALLRLLIDTYGDIDVALAAYNAGMGNVGKWLDDKNYSSNGITLDNIPFPETEKYIKRVNKNYSKYKNLY